MDSQYLKDTVGKCLSEGLAEVVERRPLDPIDFLAKWIYKYKENLDYAEETAAYKKQVTEELEKAREEELHQKLLKEEEVRIRAEQEESEKEQQSKIEAVPLEPIAPSQASAPDEQTTAEREAELQPVKEGEKDLQATEPQSIEENTERPLSPEVDAMASENTDNVGAETETEVTTPPDSTIPGPNQSHLGDEEAEDDSTQIKAESSETSPNNEEAHREVSPAPAEDEDNPKISDVDTMVSESKDDVGAEIKKHVTTPPESPIPMQNQNHKGDEEADEDPEQTQPDAEDTLPKEEELDREESPTLAENLNEPKLTLPDIAEDQTSAEQEDDIHRPEDTPVEPDTLQQHDEEEDTQDEPV